MFYVKRVIDKEFVEGILSDPDIEAVGHEDVSLYQEKFTKSQNIVYAFSKRTFVLIVKPRGDFGKLKTIYPSELTVDLTK